MCSTDGITWTPSVGAPFHKWYSITYGDGKYVAVGPDELFSNYSRSMISTDGITWQCSEKIKIYLNTVCYGNGKFIAGAAMSTGVPNTKVINKSTDGINWEGMLSYGSYIKSICYTGDKFVAISSTHYNILPDNTGVWENPIQFPVARNWHTVCYNPNGTLAVCCSSGDANRVMMMFPGSNTFVLKDFTDNGGSVPIKNWSCLCASNNIFIGVEGSTTIFPRQTLACYTSGAAWFTKPAANQNFWTHVCYGNGRFVSVSKTGSGNRAMYMDEF